MKTYEIIEKHMKSYKAHEIIGNRIKSYKNIWNHRESYKITLKTYEIIEHIYSNEKQT